MCPEQASGSPVDARADVYSVGVVLFELLTGRYPFEAPTRVDMLRAHMLEPVPSMADVRPGLWVSPELIALVQRALAKERDSRFPNAAAMLEAVDALPSAAATFLPNQQTPVVSARSDQATVDSHVQTSRPPRARSLPRGVGLYLALAVALLFAAAVGLAMVLGSPKEDAGGPTGVEGPGGDATEHAGDEGPAGAPESILEVAAETSSETESTTAPPPPEATPRPEPRDPFRGVRLPSELRRFHVRVRRGEKLSRIERREVMALQRAMPGDPRPTLILAHHFVDLHYFSDAITRYEQAVVMDPASRGDARMIRDMVRMSAAETVSERAQEFVFRVYGTEALPEIERAMRVTRNDPGGLGRLASLKRRLTAP